MESTNTIEQNLQMSVNMENEYSYIYETFELIQQDILQENYNSHYLKENLYKYNNFKNWLSENGCVFEDNLFYPISYGKMDIIGAKAKRFIHQNEAILYIPKSIIINSAELRQNEYFTKLFNIYPKLKNLNLLILTIFLLKEKEQYNYSNFKPYLDLISAEVPIFWSENLLHELDDELMIESIREHKEELTEYYNNLINFKIFDHDNPEKKFNLDLNLFMTYYSFVLSRNFCVSEDQLLLVPFADALNHNHVDVKYECFDSYNLICKFTTDFDEGVDLKNTDNTLFYHNNKNSEIYSLYEISKFEEIDTNNNDNDIDDGDQPLIIKLNQFDYFLISTSKQTFQNNSQVYNFYGQFSNEYLLKWYGFCYLSNKHDYISVILHLPKYEDLEFDRLLKIFFPDFLTETINPNLLKSYNTLRFKLKAKKFNLDFIRYLRFFFFYENDELNKFITYEFDLGVEMEILERGLEVLRLSLANKSRTYTIEEDCKKIRELYENKCDRLIFSQDETRMVNILIFRISQKWNLINHINMCKLVLEVYQNSIDHIRKIITSSVPKDENNNSEELKKTIKIDKVIWEKFQEIEKRSVNKYKIGNDLNFLENKIKKYFENLKII